MEPKHRKTVRGVSIAVIALSILAFALFTTSLVVAVLLAIAAVCFYMDMKSHEKQSV